MNYINIGCQGCQAERYINFNHFQLASGQRQPLPDFAADFLTNFFSSSFLFFAYKTRQLLQMSNDMFFLQDHIPPLIHQAVLLDIKSNILPASWRHEQGAFSLEKLPCLAVDYRMI